MLDKVVRPWMCVSQDERWEVELQREKLRQREDHLKVDGFYFINSRNPVAYSNQSIMHE